MFLPAIFILTIGLGASLTATCACRRRLASNQTVSRWRTEVAGVLGGGITAMLLFVIALPAQAHVVVLDMLPVIIPAAALLALPAAHAVFKFETNAAEHHSVTPVQEPSVWFRLWRQEADMLVTTFLIWVFALAMALLAPDWERHAFTSFFVALGCFPLNGAVGFITALISHLVCRGARSDRSARAS